jgi:hypothetical protein
MAIWYILLPIGKFNGHLLHFVVIWYIFPRFGLLYQEKFGNPVRCPSASPSIHVSISTLFELTPRQFLNEPKLMKIGSASTHHRRLDETNHRYLDETNHRYLDETLQGHRRSPVRIRQDVKFLGL